MNDITTLKWLCSYFACNGTANVIINLFAWAGGESKRILNGTAKEIWKKCWLWIAHDVCLKKRQPSGNLQCQTAINPGSPKLWTQIFSPGTGRQQLLLSSKIVTCAGRVPMCRKKLFLWDPRRFWTGYHSREGLVGHPAALHFDPHMQVLLLGLCLVWWKQSNRIS